ncbi:MAG TPA: S9 family peptidase, partial [Vicinamibacterales bacterium]|nr:S9 family peptidase [Vicinamibacterales bacterium]
ATPRAAAKRPITELDLMKFTWVADPQISPTAERTAFVRVTVNEKDNKYESSIYLLPGTSGELTLRPLTSGKRDLSPRWSPDDKWLAFVRPDDKDTPQIWLLPVNGGEARAITDLPKGAGSPVWSPDGRSIAFTSTTTQEDLKKPDPAAKPERKSDVKVITRAVYRANGNPTYVDADRHAHIWTIGVNDRGEKAEAKQLTSGDFDERGVQWSPDGTSLYFVSDRVAESYFGPGDSDIYKVPAGGGEIAKVASIDGNIGSFSLSPDGKRIAFVGSSSQPVRSYSQPDLWVTDNTPGSTARNLTANYDFDIMGGIGGDQAAPRGEQPKPIVWWKDDQADALIVTAAEHGSSNLKRVSISTGKVEPLTEGAHDIGAYTISRNGTIAAIVSTQTSISDIAIATLNRTQAERNHGVSPLGIVTHLNDALFNDLAQSEPEEIWYTSFDGKKIQGWILKPPDFDPSKKYPMILEIHGGPHSAYGNVYTHEFQWMAAKGYVVLFTNPRGSTSYGQDFGNIIQYHYPGDDYKDLMAGVDEVVKRGYVDPARLGVTGGSGGGLLTNWTITQTQRFKAAVAQRDIADWYGFWFTADFTLFQPTWFRKAPWEDPQDFTSRSPITHVGNVTTPLMLVLGDADYRTPPSDGGEMMFRALKYMKVPTVMVRFPGETHELSRSGKPKHRVERLQHILGWFDKYLQGKTVSTYDLAR